MCQTDQCGPNKPGCSSQYCAYPDSDSTSLEIVATCSVALRLTLNACRRKAVQLRLLWQWCCQLQHRKSLGTPSLQRLAGKADLGLKQQAIPCRVPRLKQQASTSVPRQLKTSAVLQTLWEPHCTCSWLQQQSLAGHALLMMLQLRPLLMSHGRSAAVEGVAKRWDHQSRQHPSKQHRSKQHRSKQHQSKPVTTACV